VAFPHPPHLDQDPLAAATAQRHALLQTQHLDLSEALASSPLWLSRKGHLSTHKIGNGKKLEYHLVVCAIAMENPTNKWWFLAGKIIYFD
jgi:hypothetical protein